MTSEQTIYYYIHNPHHNSDYSSSDSRYQYLCGHCETAVSGYVLASAANKNGATKWLMCTNCGDGSILGKKGSMFPPKKFGWNVTALPSNIDSAYTEARNCFSVEAYTACELVCRKILMHIAVEKGAKTGDTFVNYINHLQSLGYVTPPMSSWVDLIRTNGNESNHELNNIDMQRAESTLMFTTELLRLIYEMEALSKKYTNSPPSNSP